MLFFKSIRYVEFFSGSVPIVFAVLFILVKVCWTESSTTPSTTLYYPTSEPTFKTPNTPKRTTTNQIPSSEIPKPTCTTTTEGTTTPRSTTAESRPHTPASTSTTVPATTTTNPPPTAHITCLKPNEAGEYQIPVLESTAAFHIRSISPTTVSLLVHASGLGDMNIFYFLPEDSRPNEKRASEVCISIQDNVECIIQDLASNLSYVFCLMKNAEQQLSPFNCRSHFLEPVEKTGHAWILRAQLPLFVALVVTVSIICMVFGWVLTYCILLRRPTLLKGSQRLKRATGSSRMMVLYAKNVHPRKGCKSANSVSDITPLYGHIMRKSFSSRSPPTLQDSWPPLEQAPDVPIRESVQSSEFSVSTQSTIRVADLLQNKSQDMHEYESLDYYQVLF